MLLVKNINKGEKIVKDYLLPKSFILINVKVLFPCFILMSLVLFIKNVSVSSKGLKNESVAVSGIKMIFLPAVFQFPST